MTIHELIEELNRAARESPEGPDTKVYVTRNGQAIRPDVIEQNIVVSFSDDDDSRVGVWIDTAEEF